MVGSSLSDPEQLVPCSLHLCRSDQILFVAVAELNSDI